jgi:hypothetical protein
MVWYFQVPDVQLDAPGISTLIWQLIGVQRPIRSPLRLPPRMERVLRGTDIAGAGYAQVALRIPAAIDTNDFQLVAKPSSALSTSATHSPLEG